MMPGQTRDPSMTVGSLPGLGPLTGFPSLVGTAEELKYANIHHIGAMIAPVHFLKVKLGKRPPPVKSELHEEEERRKRRWEKNEVQAAPCWNKKKERKEFLQQESEWLELNVELKTQMEELKQEWQQFILMLSRIAPPASSGPTALRPPTQKAAHCWSSWRRRDHGLGGGRGGGEDEGRRRRKRVPEGSSFAA